jgi:hypothetical protein
MKQAVRVTNPHQYSEVVSWLTGKGYKPFEIGATIKPSMITLEDNYIQYYSQEVCEHWGYEIIDFENLKNRELCEK